MIKYVLLISLLIHTTLAALKPPAVNKKWLTLNGQPPAVVARGGLSGVFPESSTYALQMTDSSIPDVVMLCNLQLTKDGTGICQPDVKIDNTTNVDLVFPDKSKTYKVNGKDVTGWFSVDFTRDQLLANVTGMQNILTRPSAFDGQLPLSTVDDVLHAKFQSYWLNVQYDMFYTEHKQDIASYIAKEIRVPTVKYVSSPEIGFLKRMNGKMNKASKTKLIFVFLDKNATEPSTKQTYGEILGDLATIKSFASGIAVPKNYIWPVNKANYLDNSTTLVADAHKLGLEVYATGFANDYLTVYNYYYDPISEYMQFIDNPEFSVDGVISDFPHSASYAVACFATYSNFSLPKKDRALIITHNGASGVYPGSTDLAYEQALKDGADIIDCSVQMSKDGVAFCMDSIDLSGDTTAVTTFMSRSTTIPEIQQAPGIFSFDFTWSEIQTSLKPQMANPFTNDYIMLRNPASKNAGKFLSLAEFLELAKAKASSGILINIENAAYLASKKGLDIIGAVSKALSNATFDKQSTQKVLIQSDDTSVLSKFKNIPAYERVLFLEDEVSDAPKKPIEEIKKFADAVNLPRFSIVPTNQGFVEKETPIVKEMQDANLTVYVSVLKNEFLALAFDYFSDPTLEIATLTAELLVDGIVTEYPATADRYLSNICSNLNYDLQFAILPIQLPFLSQFIPPEMQPPAAAPKPVLDVADVVDPPLPAVAKVTDSSTTPAPTTEPEGSSSAAPLANVTNIGLSLVATMIFGLLLLFMGY